MSDQTPPIPSPPPPEDGPQEGEQPVAPSGLDAALPVAGAPVSPAPSPTDGRGVLPAVGAWVVIAVAIAVFFASTMVPPPKPAQEAVKPPSSQVELLAQTILGIRQLLDLAPPPPGMPDPLDQYFEQLELAGQGAAHELRVLIVQIDVYGLHPQADGDAGNGDTANGEAPARGTAVDDEASTSQLSDFERFADDAPDALVEDVALLRRIYTAGPKSLSDSEREALVKRHGWFGTLALAYGIDDASDSRVAIERQTMYRVVSLGLIVAVLGFLGVSGLIALIVFFVVWVSGKIETTYASSVAAIRQGETVYLETFALYLAAMIGSMLVGVVLFHLSGLELPYLMFVFVPPTLLWPFLRGADRTSWQQALGLHSGKGLFTEFGVGVACYLAMVPLLGVLILITAFLASFMQVAPSHPIEDMIRGAGPADVLLVYMLACVWAPIVEEIMFRGALYHHLRARWTWWASALLVALIFALVHPQGLVAVPALGTLAFIFAMIREWRGSMIASMTAHALNNFVVATIAVTILR